MKDDAGAPKLNGHSGAPPTLDELGKMISQMRTELNDKLVSIQGDQVLAGTALEELARSHRRILKKIRKFVNAMTDVYQRQQTILVRQTEIESWQNLHDKDHRDTMPPPSKGKRRAKLAVGAGHR